MPEQVRADKARPPANSQQAKHFIGTLLMSRFALKKDKRPEALQGGYVSSVEQNNSKSRILMRGGGASEQRTELYREYSEGVAELATPHRAKSPAGVASSARQQGGTLRNFGKGRSYGSVLHAFAPGRTSVRFWLLSVFVLLLSLTQLAPTRPAHAAINEQLNFQARLLNAAGGLVPDGNYNVKFRIYCGGDGNLAGAGSGSDCLHASNEQLLWSEEWLNNNTQGVRVANGYLTARLGSITAFGSSIDWDTDELYLSIEIGSTNGTCTPFTSCTPDGQMDPFMRLTAVPYAFNSSELDGIDSTGFAQLAPSAAQSVNSANSAINLNQIGAGDILTLQDGGTTELLFNQSGDLTLGSASDNGTLILYDGSSHTGTIQTASLGQNTVYTLPDAGDSADTICLQDLSNCSGSGSSNWTDTGTLLHPADLSGDEDIAIGGTTAGGADIFLQGNGAASGAAVFNEQGNDADFRIEGDNDTNLFVVDAGLDAVGIGDVSPDSNSKLDVTLNHTSATASDKSGVVFDISDTGAVGSNETLIGHEINVTHTGASAGTILTTGLDISVTGDGGGTSTATGLSINVTGADTNYAAIFQGGNVGVGTAAPTAVLHVLGSSGSGVGFRVNNSTSTGNIVEFEDNGTDVVTVADGGVVTLQNSADVSSAFRIRNLGGNELFDVDTSNSRVYIGDSTADGTGVLLVLDTKNTASDPTGVNGAMYYNSSDQKFRCFEQSFWRDCMPSSRTGFYYMQEFLAVLPVNSTAEVLNWNRTGAGAGQQNNATLVAANRPGVVEHHTGTATTAAASIMTEQANSILLGNNDVWRYESAVRVEDLSDGTNTYTYRSGFVDTNNNDSTDGCYFRYSDGINGGEWQGVCRSNSTESTCDTNIAVAADTWYRLTIVVNSDGSSVDFATDGTSRCQVTTNVPTGAGRNTGFGSVVNKSAGTTDRIIYLDYIEVIADFGTTR